MLQRADASRQELGYRDIMLAMMDADTAESMLPHFLYALHDLDTGVYKCLVLVALDAQAMSRCRSLHIPQLCYLLDVSALHGQDRYAYYIDLGERWLDHGNAEQQAVHDTYDLVTVGMQGGRRPSSSGMRLSKSILSSSQTWTSCALSPRKFRKLRFSRLLLTGWGLDRRRMHRVAHAVRCVLQVYFKDPLADVATYADDDILVADDHLDGVFDPYQSVNEANIGTLVMRPTQGTMDFVKLWLGGKEMREWDQRHFGATARSFVADRPSFRLKTLDINRYHFGCGQSGGCGHDLTCKIAKFAQDWRTVCSPDAISEWVSMHLACLNWACGVDNEPGTDRGLLYAHVMQSIRSLKP